MTNLTVKAGTSGWRHSLSFALGTFCSRKLSEYDQASHMEVLLPPFILFFALVIGLARQYIVEIMKKRKRIQSAAYLNRQEISFESYETDGTFAGSNVINTMLKEPEFLTDFDKEVLSEMSANLNSPRELLIIALPAIASLVLTGSALVLQSFILECLWPRIRRPDINTCITCFLAPAGLVYALSFGFMFQQALGKNNFAINKVTSELSLLDQIGTIAAKLSLPSNRHAMAMCKAVKAEAVSMAMLVQRRQPSSFRNDAPPNIKVQLWEIVDILREAANHPQIGLNLDRGLAVTTIDYIVRLNNICTDRMGVLQSRIHPLKWAFLEVLGVMTLFGVMLVDAQSVRFEITISNLTLYSVSMLCYVLADLDSPFDGFFRVDMTVLHEVVRRAEQIYNCAKDGKPFDLTYVHV